MISRVFAFRGVDTSIGYLIRVADSVAPGSPPWVCCAVDEVL